MKFGRNPKTPSSSAAPVDIRLNEIGVQYGIDQSSLGHGYLEAYQDEIEAMRIELTHIVIISGADSLATAKTFADFLPNVDIHVLVVGQSGIPSTGHIPANLTFHIGTTIAERHNVLRDLPSPQIIVEDGSNMKSDKRRSFRELFFYLVKDGLYIVEDLHASYLEKFVDDNHENIEQLLNRLQMLKSKGFSGTGDDDIELSKSIRSITNYGKIAFIAKSDNHLVKLRDHETNALLNLRQQPLKGRVLSAIPSRIFESRAIVTTNRPDLAAKLLKPKIEVPEFSIREYYDVECLPGQVVTSGKYFLADSFRHPAEWRLKNKQIVDASHRFARVGSKYIMNRNLQGTFYYLDTEYPGHFGHITSEVISRLYGWSAAKMRYPGVKALVSLAVGKGAIPDFQKRIFEAFGISENDVVTFGADESVRVQTLVAATPMFANPLWASPELKDIWGDLGSKLRTKSSISPERIFVSRRNERIRNCRNVQAVEELFRSHGFHILFPEDLPFGEQVDIFASAKSIGGFGGSGMFNMMFAESPGDRYVITSESYTAVNEYLISSVCGDNVNYFWEKADRTHPQNGWTWDAFFSDFEFDMHSSGYRLQRLLESGGEYA